MPGKEKQSPKVKRASKSLVDNPKAGPRSNGGHKPSKGKQTSWLAEQSVIEEKRLRHQQYIEQRDAALAREARHREERIAQKRQDDAKRQLEFRRSQTVKATEYPAFVALMPGTVAQKVAVDTLMAFADAEVPADRSLSRTQVALKAAGEKLTDQEASQVNQIAKGEKVVRAALNWAYTQLTASTAAKQPVGA